jgi:phospholipid transport system substrate-binding protein
MRPFARRFARRRLLASATTLLVLPLVARSPQAALSGAAAESVVRRLVDQIWAMLGEGGLDDAEWRRLEPLLEAQTDLDLLARLALGRHWRVATPAQLEEYRTLYRRFLLRTLAGRLRHVGAAALGSQAERFQILASRPVGERDVLVQTRLLPLDRPPLRVDWRLRERPAEPVIIDLIVEGISLLVTQRSEFTAVLERAGMDGLLSELRTRVADAA